MKRKSPAPPNTTDEDIDQILAALSRQLHREFFGIAQRVGTAAESFIRFAPVAMYCRHARETLGEDLRVVSKATKLPQYVLRRIEDGDALDLQFSDVERYASYLGIEEWFQVWARSNERLVALLVQPRELRESLVSIGLDAVSGRVERLEDPGAPEGEDREPRAALAPRRPSPDREPDAGAAVLQFEVVLEGVSPPVWRRLAVSADATLHEFHRTLQVAMGWHDSHLYLFELGDTLYSDPGPWEEDGENLVDSREVRLRELDLSPGASIAYRYDMGDAWSHRITVESETPAPGPLPRCLGGARACPPEDTGGAPGYEQVVEAFLDPTHRDHRDVRDWLTPDFDPERFDLEEVNRRLQTTGARRRRRAPLRVN